MRIDLLLYCIIFFLASSAVANDYREVGLWQAEALVQYSQKNTSLLIPLESNMEARVLHLENLYGETWFYVHFINGIYQGRRGWIPKKSSHVRMYGLENSEAFQTIYPEKAKYVRTVKPLLARLSLGTQSADISNPNYIKEDFIIDFFSIYPRSIFGSKKINPEKYAIHNACPKRPMVRPGRPCRLPEAKYRLPKHLRSVLAKAGKRYNVHPAILSAILHKESNFNPFLENKHEKKLCLEEKDGPCTLYRWGKGLSQLGATNAAKYGLLWNKKIYKPRACGRKHIFRKKCYVHLEKHCRKKRTKRGLYPIYCPKASILATAKYVHELISKKRLIITDTFSDQGNKQRSIVNITKHMRRNLAEEFRYITGMFNRGMRPVNSIEEHYRQNGKAPQWYGSAWATKRMKNKTPSPAMGFQILHKELINRCHVWQVAGLCGESLENTLAGQYLKDFPQRRLSSKKKK